MKIEISGAQGEGKTTLARAIAALVLDTGHAVELVDHDRVQTVGATDSPGEELAKMKVRMEQLPPRTVIVVVAGSK